jgi:hypothetical protein
MAFLVGEVRTSFLAVPERQDHRTRSTRVRSQVGFHDQSLVYKVKVDRKNNEIINRLEKTRQERFPDLEAEKQTYMSQAGGNWRG